MARLHELNFLHTKTSFEVRSKSRLASAKSKAN